AAFSAGYEDFYEFGDLLQLRALPAGTGAPQRGSRVGAENSRQETEHAGIFAASRATVVSEGLCAAGAAEVADQVVCAVENPLISSFPFLEKAVYLLVVGVYPPTPKLLESPY